MVALKRFSMVISHVDLRRSRNAVVALKLIGTMRKSVKNAAKQERRGGIETADR